MIKIIRKRVHLGEGEDNMGSLCVLRVIENGMKEKFFSNFFLPQSCCLYQAVKHEERHKIVSRLNLCNKNIFITIILPLQLSGDTPSMA
jgi:hypothetical protein